MRITFVLPAPIRIPMGGAKVVYQHAAGLTALGHAVAVVMPRRTERGLRGWARDAAVQIRDRLHGVAPEPYYQAAGVRSLVVPTASDAHVPDADVVVATGFQTARWVRDLGASKGRKVYFVQGLETFVHPEARASWHYPMTRVTCAHWLAEAVRDERLDVLGVVPNAVDAAEFFLEAPVAGRPPHVAALYHRHPVKGPDTLIDALERLRAGSAAVTATVFAARPPSHRLPDYVDVLIRPDLAALRALYNRAAVLLHPSRSEGWPLVPMEAAACGAAVVATANEGVREYLTDGASMRSVPVGDGAALAREALRLLGDDAERTRIAEAGRAAVAQYRLADGAATLGRLLERAAADA